MPVNQRQPHFLICIRTTIGGTWNIYTIRRRASNGFRFGYKHRNLHFATGGEPTDLPWRFKTILGGDFFRKTHAS
jgi:hypothetical protein